MYFPTSLKFVGAVLLSALVANAAEDPRRTELVTELTGDGDMAWSDSNGRFFGLVDDDDNDASLNPDTSLYLLYRVSEWSLMEDNIYALTTQSGDRIDASNVNLTNGQIIHSGFDSNERYWIVWAAM